MTEAQYDIAIVGGGIVGSMLASFLAPHAKVALVDRSVKTLVGSTQIAPGFVGQLNELPPLTELARRSIAHYRTIPGGFNDVGGLEIARTEEEVANLKKRAALAAENGITASLLSPQEAADLAPDFVVPGSTVSALYFPNDGTSNAGVLVNAAREAAVAAGAVPVAASVNDIIPGDTFTISAVPVNITAKAVVVCTGVWAGQLLPSLGSAAVTVSHPYVYGATRPARPYPSPFIRWPGAHVYGRDHGDCDGIGGYGHAPIHVSVKQMAEKLDASTTNQPGTAQQFDDVIKGALRFLPQQTAERFTGPPGHEPSTGVFTVTPDGLPCVGSLGDGLYCAVGVWITHAAGSAGVLADMILQDMGKGGDKDVELRKALDPKRFIGKEGAQLEKEALDRYSNIYNRED